MTVKLTPEEEEFVRKARELAAERAKLAPGQGNPITNQDKFGDPIGMDDEGNLFASGTPRAGADELVPSAADVPSIWDQVRRRVESGRARVTLNLSGHRVDLAQLKQQLADRPITGLEQLDVVHDSTVTRLWP